MFYDYYLCFRYIRLLDQIIDYQMNTLGHIDTDMVTFSSASFVAHDDKTDSSVLSTANRCQTPSAESSCSSLCDADSCIDDFLSWTSTVSVQRRAVPEFGSSSGRNPAFFYKSGWYLAPAKIGPDFKACQIWKLSLNNSNLNDLYMQNLFPTTYNYSINGMCHLVQVR